MKTEPMEEFMIHELYVIDSQVIRDARVERLSLAQLRALSPVAVLTERDEKRMVAMLGEAKHFAIRTLSAKVEVWGFGVFGESLVTHYSRPRKAGG
jgi:hypothetical protein